MNRPSVTLKLATSLDGRIALASGESQWITGEEARAEVHKLRAAHDAILVGAQTALADDPELTVRTQTPPTVQPLRVVLDSKFRLPTTSKLLRTLSLGPVLVIGARDGDASSRLSLERAGARTGAVSRGLDGLDLTAVLADLHAGHGVRALFVEGGGAIAASFLNADLIERLEWFHAPLILGGDAKPALAALNIKRLDRAPRFARLSVTACGADLWERYERVR
jgi:diaminohydroxyphosphoribosylaminopyrimidine deaminase/5-amino-6-(5-phosphoribosylamino)uracil reductase